MRVFVHDNLAIVHLNPIHSINIYVTPATDLLGIVVHYRMQVKQTILIYFLFNDRTVASKF